VHPVERISIIDQVIQQIENSILNGEYAIGSKLPAELKQCQTLSVGRSTVREAYRMLQAIGLIELRPGKGAFVKNDQRSTQESIREWFIEKEAELTDLMEVRMAVEPLAVSLAIRKGTKQQIAQIEEIHKQFKKASVDANMIQLAELDESFHTAIVVASNNHLFIKIHKLISDSFKEYRAKVFATPLNINALEPHCRIVEAIKCKDEQAAMDSINEHLRISMDDIEKVVSEK
jgi:GntR family transcriptional repressor for pyruvate dehydrogenase complex